MAYPALFLILWTTFNFNDVVLICKNFLCFDYYSFKNCLRMIDFYKALFPELSVLPGVTVPLFHLFWLCPRCGKAD